MVKVRDFICSRSFLVYGFFILHLLVSQIFLPYFEKREVFPIFTWQIFSSCNEIDSSMPEIEILLDRGDTITSKQFSSGLMYKSFSYGKHLFEIPDQERNQFLNEWLSIISTSIKKTSFEYKIFKSRIHYVDYFKSDSLEKTSLFKQGTFNRDSEGHTER